MTKSFVSGIQPSGSLHIGNYFGAIAEHLKLQDEEGQKFYFIADYHAMTSLKNAAQLQQACREIAATYIALGLQQRPDVALFRQSSVPEVQELSWFLCCISGMGPLNRSHAYKDKVERGLSANVGLFTYPILMAADILLYSGTHVPVGKDQLQHLEIASDLAKSFNAEYNVDCFVPPVPFIGNAPYVIGTDGQKMSKSYGNTIDLFADKKLMSKQVKSIVTDSKDPKKEPLNPETCSAFKIFELLGTPKEVSHLKDLYINDRTFPGYGVTKKLIEEKMEAKFGGAVREHFISLLDPSNPQLDTFLEEGAKKARSKAIETLKKCRKIVGIGHAI